MRRTLLVTNDFPPRPGGIQSYLHNFAAQLPAEDLTVFASTWHHEDTRPFDATQPYEVIRSARSVLLPSPDVVRAAAQIVRSHRIETVWFGAAAPLALMGPALKRAGAARVIAATHGHEVGWGMLPGPRAALRRIGRTTDVVTYVSEYTRRRLQPALGRAATMEHLPSGVDPAVFRPAPRRRAELRERYRLGGRPVILCLSRLVPRKGQDMLIRALPSVRARVRDATLVVAGDGPYLAQLRRLTARHDVEDAVVFTGRVASDEVAAHHSMADVFAMPCRTLGGGLDVEGLGVVYLEASATGVPAIAGRSGGAPETVLHDESGLVVDGRRVAEVADAVVSVLGDPQRATAMGAAGRAWASTSWRWDVLGERLRTLIGT